MNRTVRYLSRQDVRAACAGIDTVAAVREAVLAHSRGEAMLPAEACLRWITPSGAKARNLNMPGYVGGAIARAGTKIINANAANPDNGIPRASGICLLFDPETAQVVCIMDATYISATRTASVTVLAGDIVMLNPFGMAIEDIVIAVRVYEAAESLKMGVELLL